MFMNEHIVFLQLDKTGSTHITKMLHSIDPGVDRRKHSQLREDPGNRCIVGSVRNPWDWYVSLWAYGCRPKGKIYRQLTRSFPQVAYRLFGRAALHPHDWGNAARKICYHFHKDPEFWRQTYVSKDDPALFRRWLRGIYSDEGKRLLLDQYPSLPMRGVAGFLTYRFLFVFVKADPWRKHAHLVRTEKDLRAFYDTHCVVDRFIRNESLEQDLIGILGDLKVEFDRDKLLSAKKTNVSAHRDAGFYYDEETIELVRRHERLIVEEFGYEPPTVPATKTVGDKNTGAEGAQASAA